MAEIEKKLNVVLIQRFIVLLLLVVAVEYVVMQLIDRLIIPTIYRYFFAGSNWDGKLSSTQILLLIILLIGGVIVAAVRALLPAPLEPGASLVGNEIDKFSSQIAPNLFERQNISDLSEWEALFLFLALFAIVVLIAAPIVIAALVFSRYTVLLMQKIQKHNDEIKQDYDRRRNLMLSDIAHDLRTPITTICGYAKALQDDIVEDEDKQQEYMEAILRKSLRMNDLIHLLFDYVKLDSEGFVLDKQQVDITELLRENAALAYSDMEDKGMELLINIPEQPCVLWLDKIQLSRVITNLLVNVVRHNEPGTRVLVEMNQSERAITVVVADSGDEIPEEMAEHIFEPFARGDKSRSSNTGSGLGLSIAHKIIEMHGWELTLRNDYPGYTKEFVIEIRI